VGCRVAGQHSRDAKAGLCSSQAARSASIGAIRCEPKQPDCWGKPGSACSEDSAARRPLVPAQHANSRFVAESTRRPSVVDASILRLCTKPKHVDYCQVIVSSCAVLAHIGDQSKGFVKPGRKRWLLPWIYCRPNGRDLNRFQMCLGNSSVSGYPKFGYLLAAISCSYCLALFSW
jgi:hypothetical protein